MILRILEYFNEIKENLEIKSFKKKETISFFSDLKLNVTESNFNFNFFFILPIFSQYKFKIDTIGTIDRKNRIMLTSVVMFCAITKFFIFFQNKLWQG